MCIEGEGEGTKILKKKETDVVSAIHFFRVSIAMVNVIKRK
jgi:hypothetical protein